MYPLRFNNLYFEKIWGGRDFESFRDNLPKGDIGESWDITCHPNGISTIANGEFEGMNIDQLIQLKGEALIGTHISKEWFPLLVKLINAKDQLSVQVHPDDEYGKAVEGDMGKTEVWYVVDAQQDASLIVGTKKGCTKEQFKAAIEKGTLDEYLNRVLVEKGDVIFVKSGLVHAIGEGLIIAEIQQNSDTTYRVYDYNRGREIHVDKALDVIDLSLEGKKNTGVKIEKQGYIKTYLCLGKHFSLELYDVKEAFEEKSDTERFYIFTCVDGQGEIAYKKGKEGIKKGESILIPATLGTYRIEGKMKILKSYVPNVEQVEKEILKEIKG